tara:strand:+ start:167 stop:1522 length:1356 start_codon:yes stop_codon:yes gene_type:complete
MANTYITRTPSSTGNLRTFTISFWVKKCVANKGGDTSQQIIGQTSSQYFRLMFLNSTDQFRFYDQAGMSKMTTRRFNDTSSWYHFVVRIDTTQGTAANRCRLYVNGVQETSFSTDTNPGQNVELHFNRTSIHSIGRSSSSGGYDYFDGCLADFMVVDGQSLAPTSFGETDISTGEWRAKDLAANAFTWGTNGFRILKDGITVSDQSSNSNNWSAYGSLTKTNDSPSNNFSTLMTTGRDSSGSYDWQNLLSFGNLKGSSTGYSHYVSTLGMTTGKYYWESIVTLSGGTNANSGLGIKNEEYLQRSLWNGDSKSYYYSTTGKKGNSQTPATNYGSAIANNDIVGTAYNATSGTLWFSLNGTWQNSATINEIAAGTATNAAYSSIPSGTYVVACTDATSSNNFSYNFNFGNGYFGTTAITTNSGNGYVGAEGKSKFNYPVPSGFTALSTKGLNT